jgi:hypothetical protein
MTVEEFGYPAIQQQAKQPLKAAIYLNIIRWRIVEHLRAEYTYGYVTKYHRNKLGLEKSHENDSFVIAGGTVQERCRPYEVIQTRRNNRSLQLNRKGFKPSIRRRRHEFQPHDLVKFEGRTYKVKGTHCYGKRIILKSVNGQDKSVEINKVDLVTYGRGLLFHLY